MTGATLRLTEFADYLSAREYEFHEWKTFMVLHKSHKPPIGITPIYGLETNTDPYERYYQMIRGPSLNAHNAKLDINPNSYKAISLLQIFINYYGSDELQKIDYIVITGEVKGYVVEYLLKLLPFIKIDLWNPDFIEYEIYRIKKIYNNKFEIYNSIINQNFVNIKYASKHIIYINNNGIKMTQYNAFELFDSFKVNYDIVINAMKDISPLLTNVSVFNSYEKKDFTMLHGEYVKGAFGSPSVTRHNVTFIGSPEPFTIPYTSFENEDAFFNNVVKKHYLDSHDVCKFNLIFTDGKRFEVETLTVKKPFSIDSVCTADTYIYQNRLIHVAFTIRCIEWVLESKKNKIPPIGKIDRFVNHYHISLKHILQTFDVQQEFDRLNNSTLFNLKGTLIDGYYNSKIPEQFWRYQTKESA